VAFPEVYTQGVECGGNYKDGRDWLTVLSVFESVAIRGGLATTVGITSVGACRCERVMVPSELPHMITMGVLDICVPNPLKHNWQNWQKRNKCARNAHYMPIHPTVCLPVPVRVSKSMLSVTWNGKKSQGTHCTVESLTLAAIHIFCVIISACTPRVIISHTEVHLKSPVTSRLECSCRTRQLI
jgi:hypothetical protein